MQCMIHLCAVAIAILLVACSNNSIPTIPKPYDNAGVLQVAVNIGTTGKLGKIMRPKDIDLKNLLLILSANGQDTITAIRALDGGYLERTERKTYSSLATWVNGSAVEWTLYAETRDSKDQIVHSGDTTFVVPPNDTTEISLFLDASYSMLVANYYPILPNITGCALTIDHGAAGAESLFINQQLLGDTVTLTYDYLSASRTGIFHHIGLDVYGELTEGRTVTLYTADTSILVRSGEHAHYKVTLNSNSSFTSMSTMAVTLGAIGIMTVNGHLETEPRDTLYVDQAAVGTNNGADWENACTDLRYILTTAREGSVINMAKGTYTTEGKGPFLLKSGMTLYGGYPTGGGNREPTVYPTVLRSKGTSRVMEINHLTAPGKIDGITITSEYSDTLGGGIDVIASSLIIRDCIFSRNKAYKDGGAINAVNSSLEVLHCTFSDNRSTKGGAVYLDNGIFYDCSFIGNECGYRGGAVCCENSTFTRCTFVDNFCKNGGAVYMEEGILINCTFDRNWAYFPYGLNVYIFLHAVFGDALYMCGGTVINCTFVNNESGNESIYIKSGNIINCIVSGSVEGDATSIKNSIIGIKNPRRGYTGTGYIDSVSANDPLLDTLANYGGLVETIPINPESIARDRGTTAIPAGIDISTDARGLPRHDGMPDIGAFEVQ